MKKSAKKRKKDGRGGRREGSGRKILHPEGPTGMCGWTVPLELIERVAQRAETEGTTPSQVATEFVRRGLK